MIKSRSFKNTKKKHFFEYSNINKTETNNDNSRKGKNKILILKPELLMNLSKDKLKITKKTNLFNIKQIKRKANSNNKKPNIILPDISNNYIQSKTKTINYKGNKKRINSSYNIKPKNYKISDNIDDKKIPIEKFLYLRKKFSSKINMSKGELVEMTYGNKINLGNDLDTDIEENIRIKEILYNNPKFIIDLIEFGRVDKNEIKEFFNIESFNITWNENLEKTYREIRKSNSNILKIISFLSKTGLLMKLKKNFESKNYLNFYNYNQKEIERIYDIYERIKKYKHRIIKEAFNKIDNIYFIRDILIKEKISKIRKEYYSKKLKNYKENKNLEINLQEITEKGKAELIEIKNCIFHIRQNTNWKIFPYKKINRLKFSKSITKYNEIIQKEINIKDIKYKDTIKKEKIYLKEKINILKTKKILDKPNFIWNKFIKENIDNKRIIDYYATIIQTNFRGYIVKLFLSKIIKGINSIIINLYQYTKFKQLILKLYKMTFEFIELNKIYSLEEINKVVKTMIKKCKTRKIIFKKEEVDMINKVTKINIGILPIKDNQEIYSNIPLFNLNKYLTYLNKLIIK